MLEDKFERDPRRQQELLGRPFADDIYRQTFGDEIQIRRFDHDPDKKDDLSHLFDREFATDVKITTPPGLILIGQEKFLSNKYATFRSITIEFMQNPVVEEKGDWFKMAVQFYFTGYFNKDNTGFERWAIVDWCQMVLGTIDGNIEWKRQSNKNNCARADFKYCDMAALDDRYVIASSMKKPKKLEMFGGINE